MQYKIVSASSVDVLEASVQAQIENGWIPQGGICVVRRDTRFAFVQAMVLPYTPVQTQGVFIE